MELTVGQLFELQSGSFYVTDRNGRLVVEWNQLPTDTLLNVHIRLCGGKGGKYELFL